MESLKFDLDNKSVAYCSFTENHQENIANAIEKFDGRKAMGKILIVEDPANPRKPKSLKDRLGPVRDRQPSGYGRGSRYGTPHGPRGGHRPRGARGPSRGRESRGRERREAKKPQKTVEDLDRELSEYMNS